MSQSNNKSPISKMLFAPTVIDGIEKQHNSEIELVNQMVRTYNRELIEQGFGIKRADLKKKDFIDIRNLLPKCDDKSDMPKIELSSEEKEFGKENFWFSVIPCFTEGVLQVNDNRYIYWNMLEIKPYDDEMTLILHDYAFLSDIGWQPGIISLVKMTFRKEDHCIVLDFDENSTQLYSEIMQSLSYKKLNWTQNQIQLWKECVIQPSIEREERLKREGTDRAQEMTMQFLYYISKVNYMLAMNKPKSEKQHRKTVTSDTKIEAVTDYVPSEDTRRVRNIGNISVKSTAVPKLPTEKTVIRYKVAAWKTRGFIRKYKSGKVVHVKESIHHRKCLESKNQDPVTIKFKDSTKKEDTNE